jgi:hypothetical protein
MDYKEIELHGRKLRYYSETHIEMEYRNIKENWRQKPFILKKGYKSYHFKINGINKHIRIHRLVFWIHNPTWDIYNSDMDNSIDHIDGNPLNNKIENLRCVTNQENQFNRQKAKGYYLNKSKKKWRSQIRINDKRIHLGYFDKEEDARNAYLVAKEKYHLIVPKTF